MTDNIKLPPLPKGDIAADTCPVMWVHSNEQLQAYAREAIEADRKLRGEPVYLYRRKGQDAFVTCDKSRYDELSDKPDHFETQVLYTAPQPAEPVKHKRYAQGTALGEFGIIPMCDQVDE